MTHEKKEEEEEEKKKEAQASVLLQWNLSMWNMRASACASVMELCRLIVFTYLNQLERCD